MTDIPTYTKPNYQPTSMKRLHYSLALRKSPVHYPYTTLSLMSNSTNSPFSYSILGGYPNLSLENQIYQDRVSFVPHLILCLIDVSRRVIASCARQSVQISLPPTIDA